MKQSPKPTVLFTHILLNHVSEKFNITHMDKSRKVVDLFASRGSLLKTSDFLDAGFSKYELGKLVDNGVLATVRQGYYRLCKDEYLLDEIIIQKAIPQAIVCGQSALFHYGYSDYMPRQWSLAVPRTISRKKLSIANVPIKPHYSCDALYSLGSDTGIFNGVELPVYDRERAICDCFRTQLGVDSETFIKAVKAYADDPKKNIARLFSYADRLGVYRKVAFTMEILLNE